MVLATAHERGQTGHHAAAMSEPPATVRAPLLATVLLDTFALRSAQRPVDA